MYSERRQDKLLVLKCTHNGVNWIAKLTAFRVAWNSLKAPLIGCTWRRKQGIKSLVSVAIRESPSSSKAQSGAVASLTLAAELIWEPCSCQYFPRDMLRLVELSFSTDCC